MRKLFAILLCAGGAVAALGTAGPAWGDSSCAKICATFIRGDVDGDGDCDASDVSNFYNNCIASRAPDNDDACDCDDDGDIDASDGTYISMYVYSSGPAPDPPFASPCLDPTPDGIEADCDDGGDSISLGTDDVGHAHEAGSPAWETNCSSKVSNSTLKFCAQNSNVCDTDATKTMYYDGTWYMGEETRDYTYTTAELKADKTSLWSYFTWEADIEVGGFPTDFHVCNPCQDPSDNEQPDGDYNRINIDAADTGWYLTFRKVASPYTLYMVQVDPTVDTGDEPYATLDYQHNRIGEYCYLHEHENETGSMLLRWDGTDIAEALCDLGSGPDYDDELNLFSVHLGDKDKDDFIVIEWIEDPTSPPGSGFVRLSRDDDAWLTVHHAWTEWLSLCD